MRPLFSKSVHSWYDITLKKCFRLSLCREGVLHSSDTGKKWEYSESVHQLFIDFKKAYDSVRREVLYKILIEFGIPMKLVRLIKMCFNETYIKSV
jgi:hypothetical protein